MRKNIKNKQKTNQHFPKPTPTIDVREIELHKKKMKIIDEMDKSENSIINLRINKRN